MAERIKVFTVHTRTVFCWLYTCACICNENEYVCFISLLDASDLCDGGELMSHVLQKLHVLFMANTVTGF